MKLTREQLKQQQKIIDNLTDMAKENNGDIKEVDLNDLILNDDDGVIFKAYSVAVGYRELTFSTEAALLSYSIDTIGFNDYLILNDIIE